MRQFAFSPADFNCGKYSKAEQNRSIMIEQSFGNVAFMIKKCNFQSI
jgi:hypothetical protein